MFAIAATFLSEEITTDPLKPDETAFKGQYVFDPFAGMVSLTDAAVVPF
jgi:hypothetical protein